MIWYNACTWKSAEMKTRTVEELCLADVVEAGIISLCICIDVECAIKVKNCAVVSKLMFVLRR